MNISEFCSRLESVHGSGSQYSAKCPAHDDSRASLSVGLSQDGKIILNCHAGCTPQKIVAAMDLQISDLFQQTKAAQRSQTQTRSALAATYEYHDTKGNVVAKKLRYENKSFCWLKPDGSGGWTTGRNAQPPLYNQFHVKDADAVYVVEGEKDVDTLKRCGKAAVSLPDGSKSKWLAEYTEFFKGRAVAIIQDNDEPGKKYAQMIAANIYNAAQSVRVVDLSHIWHDMPEKADISDFLKMFPDKLAEVTKLVQHTEKWEPGDVDINELRQAGNKKPMLKTISACDLVKKDIAPLKFIVDGMVPPGLTLLAAPSKIGKSWLVLDMCLSVAAGKMFLKHNTNKCGCLYLALEDSERRLKDRMKKVLAGSEAPPGFDCSTAAEFTLGNGLIEALEAYITQHKDTRLIVIDTLQKIRGVGNGKDAYGRDYADMAVLKTFADSHDICVLLVHHLRKMKDDDVFNMISGTTGVMGAADTILAISKPQRQDENATLSMTGRDVGNTETVIKFDKDIFRWTVIGDADWLAEQRRLFQYQQSPIVQTVRELLKGSPLGWRGTTHELLQACVDIAEAYPAENDIALSKEMKKLAKGLYENDGIIYEPPKSKNGKRTLELRYKGKQAELVDRGDYIEII